MKYIGYLSFGIYKTSLKHPLQNVIHYIYKYEYIFSRRWQHFITEGWEPTAPGCRLLHMLRMELSIRCRSRQRQLYALLNHTSINTQVNSYLNPLIILLNNWKSCFDIFFHFLRPLVQFWHLYCHCHSEPCFFSRNILISQDISCPAKKKVFGICSPDILLNFPSLDSLSGENLPLCRIFRWISRTLLPC